MKTILASVLAFGLMTSAAMAESAKSTAATSAVQAGPVVLTAAQMDKVTAGAQNQTARNNVVNVQAQISVKNNEVCVVVENC